jgi:acetyltransferase-like isoleucine patch superfamily enzyme
MNIVRAIRDEIQGWGVFIVAMWPSTPIGYVLRRGYWRRKTGAREIIVARGAQLIGCEFIEMGEHNAIGEGVEFVVDGTSGLKVHIGSHILFARGVYLRSANHGFDDRSRPIVEQANVSKRVSFNGADYAIVIEDGCWIGANATIVSGAHIGRGAVIGAGSVVTGAIPAYAIAAGVPARVIGERKGGQA